MATPQESVTTVNGRRCTRSRARTAAPSIATSAAPEVTSAEAPPAPAIISQPPQVQSSAAVEAPPPPLQPAPSSTQAEAPNVVPTTAAAASSAIAAISSSSTLPISSAPAGPAAPAVSPIQSSIEVAPEQPATSAVASDPPLNDQPEQPQSTQTGIPSGGSAGIISPEQGSGDGAGLTIATSTGANIGGIVGGVLGGLFGLIIISGLLFFCLRKRRSREPFERWRQRMSEKEEEGPGFLAKAKTIPASIGVFFAKLNKSKAGPAQNPYRRHSVRSSVSSVYSTQSNGPRSRSISEPPSRLRQQLRDIGGRMPSLKRSRTLLHKKQDSFVAGSKSPFVGIVEDPVARNNKDIDNPFVDPDAEPLEPPKNLFVLNPDPNSRESSPNLQREFLDGLRDQQRAPIAPIPAAMSDRGSRDPLASIIDQLEDYNGSGTPEWLQDNHKRTQSSSTALASHPPSAMYTPSIYASADNPFLDPQDIPPVPSQPLPPNPPVRPTNAYNALSTFNATSSAVSRASNTSFYFGEPGPSRPTTKMFSAPPRRAGRQSDPFDLDRPEVLGFGSVSGRREVRASTVTRQNSRRRSSVPNWVNMDDGSYERASAVPGPLRNPSIKR
ncbi:hypothetical protein K505DRAFT_321164 [Melanomma pulvis-pyrius CBS 109.77]|uniref:Uncharacterized protein n=1 Tax=Melanomma pulvis-pyrius CBS 109.77 TaxID=1314802 RepID=A0A6A6XSA4_9PLEO|nr:hypothetical protein K505DRAFT_321164 [Melanomma pulvis-pyrius CBS 109.77]